MTKYNLLEENLIRVSVFDGQSVERSLPEILAALASGEALEFSALQPYQSHAWHAFLVQLAALALFRTGRNDLREMRAPPGWTNALRELTSGRDEPWCLVVEDLSQPAFLQPPVPEGKLDKWKNETAAPDEIDILQTAKNHDVKRKRILSPRPEHWIFALVALQTMQGYSGSGNYGIARMNGGYGNRPAFSASRDLDWSTRFARDTHLLLQSRGDIARRYDFDPETGKALLWLEPWDGKQQLPLDRLDPFFIEVCRRIRLVEENGKILARWTTTKCSRIHAKELKGNLGDPWVPVNTEDGAALTATNLHYDLLQEVLFGGDYEPSRASIVLPEDGDHPILLCRVLVRGEGKTEGYHERLIPVPHRARLLLNTPEGFRRLGELSKQRVREVKKVSNVLRQALAALIQGGPEKPELPEPLAEPFIDAFDREIDRIFFTRLFQDATLDPNEARRKWLKEIFELARVTLERAKQSAPVPSERVFRARAKADQIFFGARHRMLEAAGEFLEANGGQDDFSNTT